MRNQLATLTSLSTLIACQAWAQAETCTADKAKSSEVVLDNNGDPEIEVYECPDEDKGVNNVTKIVTDPGGNKTTTTDPVPIGSREIFVGAGFGYFFGEDEFRAENVDTEVLDDGSVFVSFKNQSTASTRLVIESHYLGGRDFYSKFDKDSYGRQSLAAVGRFIECGPLGFVPSSVSYGCGPFISAVPGNDDFVDQIGLGWMVGIGDKDGSRGDTVGTGFTLGLAVMFDDDTEVLNKDVMDRNTRIVDANFLDDMNMIDNSLLTVERNDIRFMIFFGVGAQVTGRDQ